MSSLTLNRLFSEGIQLLYGAHQQGAAQAAANEKSASTPILKKALKLGMRQNAKQIKRLEKVFATIGLPVNGKANPVMEGIIGANNKVISQTGDDIQRDLVHIAAGQVAAHYYLAIYGTLRNYAKALGNKRAAKLLGQTLDETGIIDEKLTKLADGIIRKYDLSVTKKSGGGGALFTLLTVAGVVGVGLLVSDQSKP